MTQPLGSERSKICPECGDSFSCCAGSCWCDLVPVPADILARLQQTHRDCLCPKCLQSIAGSTPSLAPLNLAENPSPRKEDA